MGCHDKYGKLVMKRTIDFISSGPDTEVDYGIGQPAKIDGIIKKSVAVEIESREAKQVRGAVLDLIWHHYPKKLLVLIPVHMTDPEVTAEQCRNIMSKYIRKSHFQIVVLEGTGTKHRLRIDIKRVKKALHKFNIY